MKELEERLRRALGENRISLPKAVAKGEGLEKLYELRSLLSDAIIALEEERRVSVE